MSAPTTITPNRPSTSTTPPVGYREPGTGRPAARRARGRLATGIVLLVAFAASTFLQNKALDRRTELVANTGGEANVSNLNSASLALLLGGLRGPLVMMLWTSSETQKQEKDLEDFDSKIELIRLLQPEFDSVHIFQMWNKAYNISVQMANKANKYATILDALEYGYKVDQQHPHDINIIGQMGQLFFDKLGGSQEQQYYGDRVRRETFPDVRVTLPADRLGALEAALTKAGVDEDRRPTLVAQAQRNNGSFVVDKLTADGIVHALAGAGVTEEAVHTPAFNENGRRVRLDPILSLDGRLLDSAAGAPGADVDNIDVPVLSWLRQFEPFPYGVSPQGIGIAYYKREQVLKDKLHQKHLQLSDLVVDNRPAVNSKNWAEGEWGAGRRAEMKGCGKPIPPSPNWGEEREKTELPTAAVAPTAESVVDAAALQEAIHHYELVGRISAVCEKEFERHTRNYPSARQQFRNVSQQLKGMTALCAADADYLKAMLLPANNDKARADLLASAAKLYRSAMLQYEAETLEHDMPEERLMQVVRVPPGTTLEDLIDKILENAVATPPDKLTDLDQIVTIMGTYTNAHPNEDVHQSERLEAHRYISRCFQRLQQLHAEPKG